MTSHDRCNKGPNVKVVIDNKEVIHESVRSVENVVKILQDSLGIPVNLTSAEVLRLNYDGNFYLSEGKVEEAIRCYDQAIQLNDLYQEGILRLMRGIALLQRAYALRSRYRSIIAFAEDILPLFQDIKLFLIDAISPLPVFVRCTRLSAMSRDGADITLCRYLILNTTLLQIHRRLTMLDSSPKWNEKKNKWPAIEGPVVSSAKVLPPLH